MMKNPAILVLEDGSVYHGISLGQRGRMLGELVFNTATTGYQEILSDASYAGQIVTFTYPHIGNTGVNLQDDESNKIWAAGLVTREFPSFLKHWRAEKTLNQWLEEQKIVGITEVDTRALTQKLSLIGSSFGCIVSSENPNVDEAQDLAKNAGKLGLGNLAQFVSAKAAYTWKEGSLWHPLQAPRFHIAVYDYGVKKNILRVLIDAGCQVTVFPEKSSLEEVLSCQPDGLVLSNGPGDPAECKDAINKIRSLVDKHIPLLGICLGHQLLALALGAKTQKLKFGHHGANHPVIDLTTGCVMITSQNHNFVVDESSLPTFLEITHRSLFDNTIQGMKHMSKPIFGFQGHPEASPGPHDALCIMKTFLAEVERGKESRCQNA